MKRFSNFIVKHKICLLILTLLLIVPAIIGIYKTKTNYDILVYLPSDIETLKGQKILTEDFNMGAFSLSIVEDISDKELIKLEKKIKDINSVNEVLSINDLTGSTIPLEMIPKEFLDGFSKDDTKLLLITFSTGTSDDETINAIDEISKLSNHIKVGGMSSMVRDTRLLVESQTILYVTIAVICSFIVLFFALDSYVLPFLLLGNIGLSLLFNMGSNILLGEISYITKAIAAVLQLGVTADFSIFLYHKYESAKKKYSTKEDAMSEAISETMISVVGSSLTTIAGFLALCSMKLTLGKDIGIVMAKGVIFGVVTVLTFFPSIILLCDKLIEKTKHKALIPKFSFIKPFVMKNYKMIFIIFIVLLIPAFLSQRKTEVYYKLDSSIPENYTYSIATNTLRNEYGMMSQEMILIDVNMDNHKTNKMIDEINNLEGIDSTLSASLLSRNGISSAIIPDNLKKIYQSDKYKLVLVNSKYEIASDELNEQISSINEIVKKYDSNAIVAGEGPLMSDLVKITAIDLKNVNIVSLVAIFLIMFFVLKSFSLPVLLVLCIEFAIFINLGCPYWMDSSIPFIASIVIGTIQLGATIDYAILMTTKYLDERKTGKTKYDAVGNAITSSASSIFVSAMCFFAATEGVYIVSKIDMIGSLCLLLARGAIFSMLIVMFVIPSVLLIFDKLIINTTKDIKKGLVFHEE